MIRISPSNVFFSAIFSLLFKSPLTMWTKYQICVVILFVVFGTLKSISLQFMTETDAMGRRYEHFFNHPFLQKNSIFLGEILCLVGFVMMKNLQNCVKKCKKSSGTINMIVEGSKGFNRFLLLKPAMICLMASLTLHFGKSFTNSSTFNTLKGSTMVLTACFTRKKLKVHEWIGIAMIFLGFVIVSCADYFSTYEVDEQFNVMFTLVNENQISYSEMVIGELLIFFSHLFIAFQYVTEENYMENIKIPSILVVGWEGVFGFIIVSSALLIFAIVPNNAKNETADAFYQIFHSNTLIYSEIVLILSSTLTSFFGVDTTYQLSAVTRTIFESAQMVFVWIISIVLNWKVFHLLHVRNLRSFQLLLSSELIS